MLNASIKTLLGWLRLWVLQKGSGWAGLTLLSLLLVGLFLFFIWGLTITRIEHERHLAIQNTIDDNTDMAAVVKVNLEQVIGKTAIYAGLASALLSGEQAMAKHINPAMNGDSAYLRFVVFDHAGRLVHSSARRQAEPELAAFVEQATQGWRHFPPPDSVLVGRPQNANDVWRIPLLAGIQNGSEKQGVFVAVLDLGYFLQLFRDVHLGSGERIEIVGDDGYQLVESSGATLSAGRDFQGSDYLHFLREKARGAGVVLRSGDQSGSVTAYDRLEKFPLAVVVSRYHEDVLTEFKARRAEYLWAATLVSLLVLVGAVSLVRLAHRQYTVHRALVRSEGENRKLIEQLEEETKRAYQLASHDHLTALPNRMLFNELAVSHLMRARRNSRYHAVLFIDLDRFKAINDTLGHRIGDLLLKEVARRYRAYLRESDLVARFGGDEFVMLINDVETVEDVGKIAEKIVDIVSEPFLDLDGQDVEVSPSIGIALFPQDGGDIETLLKHADAAMYTAKAAGRGTYRFYDKALNKRALRQMELLQGLRRAIRDGDFVLHYQPRVATSDFSLVGLEALVRWQHPEFGLIYPNDFIALAEENDLIAPLGQWVINAACAQLVDWRLRGLPVVPVAVNISAKQFRSDSLVADICDTLLCRDIPAQLFEIEITESCLVDHPERVAAMLAELVAHGVKVSIDDYGTGFASLGYLKTLPLHAIKIDRSFIREIHNDASDAMIVSSTTILAHNLDLLVVAEGVETRDQLVHLKTIGCDQVQGFYFHRPVVAEDIEPVLRSGRFVI